MYLFNTKEVFKDLRGLFVRGQKLNISIDSDGTVAKSDFGRRRKKQVAHSSNHDGSEKKSSKPKRKAKSKIKNKKKDKPHRKAKDNVKPKEKQRKKKLLSL